MVDLNFGRLESVHLLLAGNSMWHGGGYVLCQVPSGLH